LASFENIADTIGVAFRAKNKTCVKENRWCFDSISYQMDDMMCIDLRTIKSRYTKKGGNMCNKTNVVRPTVDIVYTTKGEF